MGGWEVVIKFFPRKGDKHEKGGDVKMGFATFLITLHFNPIHGVCVGKVKLSLILPLMIWLLSPLSKPCKILIQVFTLLKNFIYCVYFRSIWMCTENVDCFI